MNEHYHASCAKIILVVFILSFIALTPGLASAHFPWINVEDFSPDQGSNLSMTIGYGHAYPFAGFLSKDKVESLLLRGPVEKTPDIHFTSDFEIKSSESLSAPGVYVVTASKNPGFYTKTIEGGKQTSRKGLKNVIKCSYSHNFMKAIVNVGDGPGRVDAPCGHVIEIIPMKNPKVLHAGDTLPVKVLYKGKPWAGEIFATYAGFSTEKDAWSQKVKTDRDGTAKIHLKHGGYWLLKVAHDEKYPDPSECDNESYIASLTFELK